MVLSPEDFGQFQAVPVEWAQLDDPGRSSCTLHLAQDAVDFTQLEEIPSKDH